LKTIFNIDLLNVLSYFVSYLIIYCTSNIKVLVIIAELLGTMLTIGFSVREQKH